MVLLLYNAEPQSMTPNCCSADLQIVQGGERLVHVQDCTALLGALTDASTWIAQQKSQHSCLY